MPSPPNLRIDNLHLHIHVSDGSSGNVAQGLSSLTTLVKEGFHNMANELADLQAQVQANQDVENSALVLIQGIAARLEAAGTDPAALSALTSSLKGSADALAAAVVENTPVSV